MLGREWSRLKGFFKENARLNLTEAQIMILWKDLGWVVWDSGNYSIAVLTPKEELGLDLED